MQTVGIFIEYNPLHTGHIHLLTEARRKLGSETAVIGVMSGDFVQRGDFAIVRRQARARAAVESGVDLVLELPLPWAVGSAERFAGGGVSILDATGVVDVLAFGSECGDADAIMEVAACLDSEMYHAGIRQRLSSGMPFASCRQAVVKELLGQERAALLEGANNNLGVEYCKALLRRKSRIHPLTIPRLGAAHDGEAREGEHPSASAIRALLRNGERERALSMMAPAMASVYLAEEQAGRAPVCPDLCERAVLSRLRSMRESEFAELDEGGEGLYHRLYDASRTAVSVSEVLEEAKTKRYAHARLRRMVLWAWLGLRPAEIPEEVPYLRVLAATGTGRKLLARMRKNAVLPVLTKAGDVRYMSREAREVFALEARAADLYALAYPDLSAAVGESLWREGPVIL